MVSTGQDLDVVLLVTRHRLNSVHDEAEMMQRTQVMFKLGVRVEASFYAESAM